MKGERGWVAPLAVLALVHVLALAAGVVAPYDYAEQHRALSFAPPTSIHLRDAGGAWHLPFVHPWVDVPDRYGEYAEDRGERFALHLFRGGRLLAVDDPGHVFLLGADRFGRDLLSRLLYGARISLFAGLLAGLAAVGLGLVAGALAGYWGGLADVVVMRTVDLFLALPWLYLLLGIRAFLPLDVGAKTAFLTIVAVIGALGWAGPARLVRGAVLSAKERDFVRAARGFGFSELAILRRHVVPRVAGVALTQLTLLVPRYVLAEITLSFLGLGIGEPEPSWGNLLASLQEVSALVHRPWLLAPALALLIVVMSYHRLSTALQRRFDLVSV